MAVPKLRFKEFDGDLTESKLVELTLWASGGTPAKDIPEYWGDDIPLISGASMHTNQLYESDVKITRLGLQKGSKLAPKDSILILVRGSMLFNKIPMGITLGDVAFNQDVKCIRPKQEVAPQFLFQWLHAKENTIQNKVTATGIGAGKLDTADLQNLKLYKPSSEEQTKIASFLSAVDEKISQLTQKHELLSQYKQGMMQKLFSQHIRFKADDGSEFGEWENKALNTLCSRSYQGINTVADKVEYQQSGYPILQAKHITSEKLDLVDVRYLSDLDYEKYKEKYIPNVNDILFSNIGTIGKVVLVDAKNPFFIAWNIFLITPKETLITPLYLSSYLRWLTALNYFDNLQTGNATKFINKTDLLATVINLPCLAEQTKIANFLSAIDQKIEVVAQQIEQAKTWKKGLLQQMFV
ncbi:restriction endonuclease subunit S [Acinetobacter lwoffii]|nr:restriction endonuclease subunit S [Acinetobacter lwoffii]QPF31519.1 restriction endonuclease subunit S [Acinetobacter lwoffii]